MKYFTEIGRQYNNFTLDKSIKHLSCGKEAISTLIKKLDLKETDEVYINSTFYTKYVSSCVTSTIFNYCKPSKVLSEKTKLIFIIHEFGFPNETIFKLIKISQEKEIPLVEDCAQSAYSFYNNGERIGSIGDYAIYSLKKIIPYNNAGILLKSSDKLPYLDYLRESAIIRRNNYNRLADIFVKKSIHPYKDINENISPYVFPFKINPKNANGLIDKLNKFDLIYWVNLDIYTLPIHQMLDTAFFEKIAREIL